MLFVVVLLAGVGFVSAACEGGTPDDFCFGTKVHGYRCNGTEYVDYVKGDCAIVGMGCKNAECVDITVCDTNSDCDDGNVCTTDSCVGETKKRCENIIKEGCKFENVCAPIGSRVVENNIDRFCSFRGVLVKQKGDEESCQNNYECKTNACQNGKCVEDFSKDNTTNTILGIIIILLMINIFILFGKYRRS